MLYYTVLILKYYFSFSKIQVYGVPCILTGNHVCCGWGRVGGIPNNKSAGEENTNGAMMMKVGRRKRSLPRVSFTPETFMHFISFERFSNSVY